MSHETNLAACQHLVISCLVLSNGCVCSYMTDSLQKFRIILSVHWWTHFLLNIVHQLRHVHMGHTKHIQVLGNRRHYWQPQREHSAVSSLAKPDSHTKNGRDGESRCVALSVSPCKRSPLIMWRNMSTNDISLRHICRRTSRDPNVRGLKFGNETGESTCLPTKTDWEMEEDTLELFQSIGLSENKARETAKNAAVSATLKALIVQVGTVIDTILSTVICG